MKDEISEEVRKKAYSLLKEGKVKKELETAKRVHFKVVGETEEHSVIYDKEKDEFNCDCKYSTLQRKECSHVVATKLLIKKF